LGGETVQKVIESDSVNFPVDREHVEELQRSKEQRGEREAVKIAVFPDGSTEVINGRHRMATPGGWKKVEYVKVKDRLTFLELRVDYLNQRKPPPSEWIAVFTSYGDELVRMKLVEQQNVGAYIWKHLSPFSSKDYTYSLIPRHFKSNEGRPPDPSIRSPDTGERLPKGIELAQDVVHAPELTRCSKCGFEGIVIAHILQNPV
jgi:hypothetical protein